LESYLAVGAFLFTASSMLGCYVGMVSPELREFFMEWLRRGVEPLLPRDPVSFMVYVLWSNASKCLGAIVFGVFFGLAPAVFGAANGFVLGIVSVAVSEAKGPAFVVAALTPHGVFEVPAMLFSVAAGLREGWALVRRLNGEDVSLREELKRGLTVYVKLVLPLLVVAAFMESFVAPLVAAYVS